MGEAEAYYWHGLGDVWIDEMEAAMILFQFILISKSPNGCFQYLNARTQEKDWDTFYPIIRAMVENWYDLSNNFLGIALPDSLLE